MLLRLYSSYDTTPAAVQLKDDESEARPNGHVRIPTAADRQAQDAEEFELEGLMSDDDEVATKKTNGRPTL
jgi:hypothetical protein